MRRRNTKYNNQKVTRDGILFDSKKEALMYSVLKQWQQEGKIKDLEMHPVYELQARFMILKKGKLRVHRPITYSPDFVFYDIGQKRIRVPTPSVVVVSPI